MPRIGEKKMMIFYCWMREIERGKKRTNRLKTILPTYTCIPSKGEKNPTNE